MQAGFSTVAAVFLVIFEIKIQENFDIFQMWFVVAFLILLCFVKCKNICEKIEFIFKGSARCIILLGVIGLDELS